MKIIITKAIGSNLRNIWKQYKANKSKIHKTLVMRTIKSSTGRIMSLNQIYVKFGLHCVYFNSDTS
jgi:hypothetical protein